MEIFHKSGLLSLPHADRERGLKLCDVIGLRTDFFRQSMKKMYPVGTLFTLAVVLFFFDWLFLGWILRRRSLYAILRFRIFGRSFRRELLFKYKQCKPNPSPLEKIYPAAPYFLKFAFFVSLNVLSLASTFKKKRF